jgi:hypothetical protein
MRKICRNVKEEIDGRVVGKRQSSEKKTEICAVWDARLGQIPGTGFVDPGKGTRMLRRCQWIVEVASSRKPQLVICSVI